jgi:cytochrome c
MRTSSTAWRCLAAAAAVIVTALAATLVVATPAAAAPATRYRVLVFTGANHDPATAAGLAAIRRLGRDHRFAVDATATATAFTPTNLDRYATVVFLNAAGDHLDDAAQAAFEAYVRGGGGFLGTHSAIEAEPEWQFLTDLLGTRATGTSATTKATVEVADQVHPASDPLPEYWQVTDRWYNFTGNVRGVSHVLATVDENTYPGGTMGFDHPISWCKDYQGGRSFYIGRGGTAASFGEQGLRAHLLGAIEWSAGRRGGDCGATVLANYEMTVIARPPNIGEPIGFDVLPDGRVIQTARTGEVRLHEADGSATHLLATIPVYTHSEDGLYGPTLDPDFQDNGWVYLYYAPPLSTPAGNAPVTSADPAAWDAYQGYFQLSRFRFVDGPEPSLDLASEQQILRVPVVRGTCCHVAGEIRFDSHGNLLLATGDDTNAGGSGGYAPINDQAPPESTVYQNPAYDARRTAGNTNSLNGKILRIRVRADGSYTIPRGNLFRPGTPRTRPEIYAMGLRNPFRINLDDRDRIYVTDYSPDARVPDPARGPEGTGRMMVVDRPGNYGWPYCVQPDLPYLEFDFATGVSGEPFDCAAPVNDSRHNTGRTTLPRTQRSELWYTFNATTPCRESYLVDPPQPCPFRFPELGTGGGVGPHGAAPYVYDPDLDSPTKFPEYYDGAIFFGEFTRDYLREIRLDRDGDVFQINSLLNCGGNPSPFLCDNPMDMKWGADGNFYLLTYGDGFFQPNPDALMVRFSYNKGQRAPIAVLSANPTSGQAPLAVSFSSAGSRDPDPGDAIGFAWDFDGNGTVDSTEPNPSHTYQANGQFTATLTVTDSNGKASITNTTITVGNTAPAVEVTTPAEGGLFAFGDAVPWSVAVSDPEDGAIDCGRVEVTFVLGHDEHGHGGATQTGCSGVYQTEASEADHAGGHLFGGFSATYTDLGGAGGVPPLTTVDQVSIQQRHQEVEFATTQSGTNVQTTTDTGGGQHRGSLSNGDWVALNASYRLGGIDSLTFRVANAGTVTPGGPLAAVEVRLDAVDGPVLLTAPLTATGGTSDWQSQTFPVTDPGGLHELYLVIRSVDGGATGNNLFNLNWVEFGGPGVSQ